MGPRGSPQTLYVVQEATPRCHVVIVVVHVLPLEQVSRVAPSAFFRDNFTVEHADRQSFRRRYALI